jgi:hypothetical protein
MSGALAEITHSEARLDLKPSSLPVESCLFAAESRTPRVPIRLRFPAPAARLAAPRQGRCAAPGYCLSFSAPLAGTECLAVPDSYLP